MGRRSKPRLLPNSDLSHPRIRLSRTLRLIGSITEYRVAPPRLRQGFAEVSCAVSPKL